MDLILRLWEEMKNRSSHDKILEKVWGASGRLHLSLKSCMLLLYSDEIVFHAVFLVSNVFKK